MMIFPCWLGRNGQASRSKLFEGSCSQELNLLCFYQSFDAVGDQGECIFEMCCKEFPQMLKTPTNFVAPTLF